MVRLDFANTGWYAYSLQVNEKASWRSGCVVLSGHNPPPHRQAKFLNDPRGAANNHFTVACLMELEVAEYVSAAVYANSDNDYTISSSSSGFSMALLDTKEAVASTTGSSLRSKKSGLMSVTGLSTAGYPTLMSTKSFDARQGRFVSLSLPLHCDTVVHTCTT